MRTEILGCPALVHEVKNGCKFVAVCLAPPPERTFGWGMADWYDCQSPARHPSQAAAIAELAKMYGVKEIFAPSVGFHSALIANQAQATTRIDIPNGVPIFRNKSLPWDGNPINARQGWIMSGGGCPPMVMTGRGNCIPFHASRPCMLDVEHITGRAPARKHASVIHAAWAKMRELSPGIKPHEVSLWGGFNIKPEEFPHDMNHPDSQIAQGNRDMYEYLLFNGAPKAMNEPEGFLNLPMVGESIAEELGFKSVTFTDPLEDEFAHTRREDPWLQRERNAVFIARCY